MSAKSVILTSAKGNARTLLETTNANVLLGSEVMVKLVVMDLVSQLLPHVRQIYILLELFVYFEVYIACLHCN